MSTRDQRGAGRTGPKAEGTESGGAKAGSAKTGRTEGGHTKAGNTGARAGASTGAKGTKAEAGSGPEHLAEYRRKRDFARTAEPRGKDAERGGEPVFVVQIHDASSMHFDFRLEVDGVLKSWAVPKGPSDDPHDKRLAMHTEDHPMEYRHYEGVIAAGEYGGGTVIVWDEGGYRNLSKDRRSGAEVPFAEALERGHASFWLDGAKLHGGYALTRIRDRSGRGDAWLLVKQGDARAGDHGTPAPERARSARTGRTLRQVAEESAPELIGPTGRPEKAPPGSSARQRSGARRPGARTSGGRTSSARTSGGRAASGRAGSGRAGSGRAAGGPS